jgi:hypothetical protein
MRRLFPLLLLLLVATAVHAQTVTRVGVVAKPKAYTGQCPAEIQFIGTIHVSRQPVAIDYVWERSDGAKSPRRRVVIRSAGEAVREYWTLGAHRDHLQVWEQLHVLAPTNIRSPRAFVHVNCR